MLKKHFFRAGLFIIIGQLIVMSMTRSVDAAIDANAADSAWLWSPYSIGLCLVVDDSVDGADEIEREAMSALLCWQANWLNGICDFRPERLPREYRQMLLKMSRQMPSNRDHTGRVDHTKTDGQVANALQTNFLQHINAWARREKADASPGEELLQSKTQADELLPLLPSTWEQYDKMFFVVIVPREVREVGLSTVGWSTLVFELDVRTQHLGEMLFRDVALLSQLPESLFDDLAETLTPIAKVVRVDEDEILLEERAGELLTMQSFFPVMQSQQVLLPITRTNNRDGDPLWIRQVNWTFFFVEKNATGLLSTTLRTGLRSPINAQKRPRHQQLALMARQKCDYSTIRLTSYLSQETAVPVCDILETVPGRKQAIFLGTTTPYGEFRVDAVPDRPVRLLYVRNGTNLIARLPIMPGVEPVMTAEVPVTDSTLYAESLVLGLQEEVLDLVATRQILALQAVVFRQRSDRKGFDETLLKLRHLKTQKDYISELNIMRLQLPYDDPVSRRRIETMFDQTRKMVEKSLPPIEIPWTTKNIVSSP